MSECGGTPGGEDADAALAQLGRAITRAASALAAIPGNDEATAYRCARALDAALGDLAELLRTAPRISWLGDPGPVVSERLEQRRAELATRRAEVTGYREKLDELAETERNLAEVTAQSARLRDRIGELERAERLAQEIPGLRAQMKVLEEAVAAAGSADASEIGARIAVAAEQFTALTGRQREAIGAEADTLVSASDRAATELDEQRIRRDTAAAELERRESEAAQIAANYREMLPVLTAWSQADADLANGLSAAGFGTVGSALETVGNELNGICQRLAELDQSLQPLLAKHAKAYEDTRQARSL
jgi:chromosome segregation ATPase